MKNFGIIGVGGYIAPRHLKAIKETGNNLIVALDKNDSVGIMDSYFPQCSFYTEYERFDRFVEKIKHTKDKLDFVTVCTPNYLHDSHIRFGLRAGADVICENLLCLILGILTHCKRWKNKQAEKSIIFCNFVFTLL